MFNVCLLYEGMVHGLYIRNDENVSQSFLGHIHQCFSDFPAVEVPTSAHKSGVYSWRALKIAQSEQHKRKTF